MSRTAAERNGIESIALVATLCGVQFIDVLSTTVVIVALPAIQGALGLGDGAREQVAAVYALLFGALLLLAGRLADVFGARRLFIAGLVAFGVGSLFGGLAPEGVTLIAGRAVQGVGAALAVPAALALLTARFPPGASRDRVFGVWAATGAAGGAMGFLLGGIITDAVGWRWVLLLNVPVVAIAAVAMLLIPVARADRATLPISIGQSVLLTAGLLTLIVGLTNASTGSVRPMVDVPPIVAGLVALGLFARRERGDSPLVPQSVWRDHGLIAGSLVGFTLTFTTSAAAVLLTLFLQQGRGVSASATGWVFATFSAGVIAGAGAGGRAMSRLGPAGAMTTGLLGVVAGLAGWIVAVAVGSVPLTVVGLAVSGVGLGVATVASTSVALAAVRPADQGAASGLLNAAARVGTALGIAVFGIVAAAGRAVAPGDVADPARPGYQFAFGAGIVLCLVAIVLTRSVGPRDHVLREPEATARPVER